MPKSLLLPPAETEAVAAVALSQVRRGLRWAAYADDPVGFARDVMGMVLTPQEVAVCGSVIANRRTAVPSGHSLGKTFVAALLVSWWFETRPRGVVLTTAPTWAATWGLLWREVSAQRKAAPGSLTGQAQAQWRGITTRLWGNERHFATAHNAESGEAFQGVHEADMLLVLDEAPGVPGYIWDACDSMLQSPSCRMLAIGNPMQNAGPFHDVCADPGWRVVRLSSLDHPNISAELRGELPPVPPAVRLVWVEEMLARHCQPSSPRHDTFEFPPESGRWWSADDEFRPRVLGLEPRQSSRAVWSEGWIEAARMRALVPSGVLPEIGVDVARYGDDDTVIVWRRGSCVLGLWRRQRQGITETAGDVTRLIKLLAESEGVAARLISIKVDDTGLGGGVTDSLREQGYRVIPINAAEVPHDPESYPNRRAELWFGAAEAARDGQLDLMRLSDNDYNALRADLLSAQWRVDSRGRRAVEPKDDIRKRLGRSPDAADAFNLCFAPGPQAGALPVVAKNEPAEERQSGFYVPRGHTTPAAISSLGGVSGRFVRRRGGVV